MRRPGVDRLPQQGRVEGLAREDPQVIGSGQRRRGRCAPPASNVTASMTWPSGRPRGVAPDELEGAARDASAAGLFARMAAVDERHARAAPGEIARGHGARRSGPGDDRVEGVHAYSLQRYRDQIR